MHRRKCSVRNCLYTVTVGKSHGIFSFLSSWKWKVVWDAATRYSSSTDMSIENPSRTNWASNKMTSLGRGICSVPEKEHVKGSRNMLTFSSKMVCKCSDTVSMPTPTHTRSENVLLHSHLHMHALHAYAQVPAAAERQCVPNTTRSPLAQLT